MITNWWNPSSPKQQKQRELRQALGTVIGIRGYLNNLNSVVKRTCLDSKIKALFEEDVVCLNLSTRAIEDQIRLKLKNL